MEHEIRGGDGTPGLEATSALVAYDYEADAAMAVPEDWRTRLDAYEERSSQATCMPNAFSKTTSRTACASTADMPGAKSVALRHGRRLALRDARHERDRALRRA